MEATFCCLLCKSFLILQGDEGPLVRVDIMLNQASESEMPPFQACQGKAAGILSLAGPQLDLLRLLSLLKIRGHLVSRDQSLAHLKWSANIADLVYAQTSAELPGVKEKKRIPGLPGSLQSG